MSSTAQINPQISAPINASALAAKIEALIERRQFDAAERLIQAVAAMTPDQPPSSILGIRLAIARGDHAKAADALDAALAAWPEAGDLLRLRAHSAMTRRAFAEAAQAAAGAIIADPQDAVAKSLLGRALLALGDSAQARICLLEATAANPHDVPAALALAEASPEQASLLLAAACARLPHEIALQSALIRILINKNEPEAACQAAAAAQDMNALDADGYVLAGHAAAVLDDWPRARHYWQKALRLAYWHASALYRLAADRARQADRLDSSIIAMADNARADTAELVALAGGTILPGRVRAALIAAGISGPVLDLGCGTGLCAIAAGDLGFAWEGVEAASKLAAIAKEHGLYRTLHQQDPISFLGQNSGQWQSPGQWQAIAFNFTAGLVRDLEGLFGTLAAHLAAGGVAIGAVVLAPVADRFGAFGCFEHTEATIRGAAAAAGLAVTAGKAETLMMLDGLAMTGLIITLRKT